MRPWQIIIGGTGAATVFCAVCLSAEFSWHVEGWPWRTEWALITIAWASVYGLAVLMITTSAFWAEIGKAQSNARVALIENRDPAISFGFLKSDGSLQALLRLRQIKRRWRQRYFIRLGTVQFFTAIVVLLGLGVTRVDAKYSGQMLGSLPVVATDAPALTMTAFLAVAGLLGSAIALIGTLSLARRALPLFVVNTEIGLLRQISDGLNAKPLTSAASPAELTDAIAGGQRVVLAAIKDLATSFSRLVRRGDIEASLLSTADKLATTAAALDATLLKLNELTAPPLVGYPSSDSSQVALELHNLLREVDNSLAGSKSADPDVE